MTEFDGSAYQMVQDALNAIERPMTLVAVSKRQSITAIVTAYAAGQIDFAESYVNEAMEKLSRPEIKSLNKARWHFIGPVQRNKTKMIAEHFDWVQSVDRKLIVERLANQRPPELSPLKLLIQVNVDAEDQKSGVHFEQVDELAKVITSHANLRLHGIMGIPKKTNDIDSKRASFKQLYECYLQLQRHFDGIDTLSMGMSSDWALATKYGSTMVRLGTSLFGIRD